MTPGVIGGDLDRLWNPVSLANKGDLVQLHLDTESRKLVVAVTGLDFQMAFGTEFPAMLSYDIGDRDGSMIRMVAPRIRT